MSRTGSCKGDDIQTEHTHVLHEILLVILGLGGCVCLNEGVGVHEDGPAASHKPIPPIFLWAKRDCTTLAAFHFHFQHSARSEVHFVLSLGMQPV